jgi:hypothetical protein
LGVVIIAPMSEPLTQSTRLSFLANDGAITVTFTPAISGEQYIEVFGIATGDFGSCLELRNRLKIKANEWGVLCHVDDC